MDKTCGTWTTCRIGSCQRHQECMYRPCRNITSPRSTPVNDEVNREQALFTPEAMVKASKAVERYCAELDITNADRIALWLETNSDEPRIAWLAVQIAEAFDRAIRCRHVSWGPGDPDCPPEIKAGNGELHTLRCKVCGQDMTRANAICFGESPHG